MKDYHNIEDKLSSDRAEALVNYFLESNGEEQDRQLQIEEFFIIIAYFIFKGQQQQSMEAIRRAIAVYPNDENLRIFLVKNYIMMQDIDAAEKELNLIQKNFPPSTSQYDVQAFILLIREKTKSALKQLRQASSIDDFDSETLILTTAAYLQLNDLEQALTTANKAINFDKYAAEKMTVIIPRATEHTNPDILKDFYKHLVEEFPLSAAIWNELGNVYTNTGDYRHAIEAYKYQTSLEPEDALIYYAIGRCYVCLEDFENALENFNIANEKSDGHQYIVPIGICYYNMGNKQKAEHYLLKATPDCIDYRVGIGILMTIYLDRGDIKPVLKFLTDQYKEAPDNFNNLIDLLIFVLPISNQKADFDPPLKLCTIFLDNHADNLIDYFKPLIYFCCEFDFYQFGFLLCNAYADEPQLCDVIGYYLAALNILDGKIQIGCDHLENALFINPGNCLENFILINEKLGDEPKVLEILELHKNEIGYDDFVNLFEKKDNTSIFNLENKEKAIKSIQTENDENIEDGFKNEKADNLENWTNFQFERQDNENETENDYNDDKEADDEDKT